MSMDANSCYSYGFHWMGKRTANVHNKLQLDPAAVLRDAVQLQWRYCCEVS